MINAQTSKEVPFRAGSHSMHWTAGLNDRPTMLQGSRRVDFESRCSSINGRRCLVLGAGDSDELMELYGKL